MAIKLVSSHLGSDGGELGEGEEVDEPHADDEGGEVELAQEVDGGQVQGEEEPDAGHQLVVAHPVDQEPGHQARQAVHHAATNIFSLDEIFSATLTHLTLPAMATICK